MTEQTPFGCRWCGVDHSSHGQRWTEGVGVHEWEQPTQPMILDRMRTRREKPSDTPAALMGVIQELHALQQPLVDALRSIREDMDRAHRGGDEWATEWMAQVWNELPLAVRAAGGDQDAAQELADHNRAITSA